MCARNTIGSANALDLVSIDWHIQSGIMNMFAKTFVLAFDKMSLKVIKQGEQNEDTAYLIDVDWHAVRGSRCSKVLAGLSDKGTFARIVILGVVLEPIRWSMMGNCFRVDCKIHTDCKFYMTVKGKFEAVDAAVLRWCISGDALSAAQHREAGLRVKELF